MSLKPIKIGPTWYFVAHGIVPTCDELPWKNEPCDAFVLILDPAVLGGLDMLPSALVGLPTEWIETLGMKSETLHDRIDAASVAAGRQLRVGDGNPMTAWHDDVPDVRAMVDYLMVGGHGSALNKLIVVIGSAAEARDVKNRLVNLSA